MIAQRVHYQLHNGKVVSWDTGSTLLNNEVINQLTRLYIEATNELPTTVFLGPDAYQDVMSHQFHPILPPSGDMPKMFAHTCAGYIAYKVCTHPSLHFVMVGQDKDYARYKLDDVFEEEVLEK